MELYYIEKWFEIRNSFVIDKIDRINVIFGLGFLKN